MPINLIIAPKKRFPDQLGPGSALVIKSARGRCGHRVPGLRPGDGVRIGQLKLWDAFEAGFQGRFHFHLRQVGTGAAMGADADGPRLSR